MSPTPDQVALVFEPGRLRLLQGILGLILFGIALDIRLEDFRQVARAWRPVALGLTAQFFLLPFLTWLLVVWIEPWPSMALGMMLVAACPGGNVSNYMTHLAGGNVALSVSLSAVSTLGAIVMTPFNLAFWAARYGPTSELLREVRLDPIAVATTVGIILGVPVVLGMTLAARKPAWAERLRRPLRLFSIVAFAGFILAALMANAGPLAEVLPTVAGLVALHNAIALAVGYLAARAAGVGEADRRAVALEVGIQNSALGLVLIFDFFSGLGGMAIIAAWWGVWHLIAGSSLAIFWSRRPCQAPDPPLEVAHGR